METIRTLLVVIATALLFTACSSAPSSPSKSCLTQTESILGFSTYKNSCKSSIVICSGSTIGDNCMGETNLLLPDHQLVEMEAGQKLVPPSGHGYLSFGCKGGKKLLVGSEVICVADQTTAVAAKFERDRLADEARQETRQNAAAMLSTLQQIADQKQAQRQSQTGPAASAKNPMSPIASLPATQAQRSTNSVNPTGDQAGGYNVAQGPRRERVNVPGHIGCISMEAVPRKNQNLAQTFRVKNECPMPLRVQYCYGDGCTKALGAGEEIGAGEIARIYVERSYGYVLRILQACSLMTGSDPVSYLSPTNQCSAVITMR